MKDIAAEYIIMFLSTIKTNSAKLKNCTISNQSGEYIIRNRTNDEIRVKINGRNLEIVEYNHKSDWCDCTKVGIRSLLYRILSANNYILKKEVQTNG